MSTIYTYAVLAGEKKERVRESCSYWHIFKVFSGNLWTDLEINVSFSPFCKMFPYSLDFEANIGLSCPSELERNCLSSVLQNSWIFTQQAEYLEQRSSGVLCKSSQPHCLCDLSSTAKSMAIFPIQSVKPNEGPGFDWFSRSLWVDGISHQSKSCEGVCGSCASSFCPKLWGKLPAACRDLPGVPAW